MTGTHRDPIVTDKAKQALKLIKWILWIVLIVLVILILLPKDGDGATEGSLFADEIPTIVEIQTLLVNAGYDIGTKGIDGDMGGDTIAAWELAINNQHNTKYYYMYKD